MSSEERRRVIYIFGINIGGFSVSIFGGFAVVSVAFFLYLASDRHPPAANPATHSDEPRTPTTPIAVEQFNARQRTGANLSLEENVRRLSHNLEQNNQLSGKFADYTLVMPPQVIADASRVNIGTHSYDIAFVGPSLYTFHSSDGGVTWLPMPSTDPFLLKVKDDFVRGKRSADWVRELEHSMTQAVEVKRPIVELPQYDWETSGLTKSYYRNETAELHWWLHDELKQYPKHKQALEGLAEVIRRQADGCGTTINEYSQKGLSLWAAGEYSTAHKWVSETVDRLERQGQPFHIVRGFICYSSDNGKSWVRQWFSGRSGPDPVYGLFFSDAHEGWAFTFIGILRTHDGGSSWKRVLECEDMSNLFILDKNRLIVSAPRGSPDGRRFYSSRDRGLSWMKVTTTPQTVQELVDVESQFGGKGVHYGGIYSYEGNDKE